MECGGSTPLSPAAPRRGFFFPESKEIQRKIVSSPSAGSSLALTRSAYPMQKILRPWLLLILVAAAPLLAHAASHPLSSDDLQQAYTLSHDHKFAAAAKIYAKWLKTHPDDPDVLFRAGYNQSLQASAESDRVRSAVLAKQAYEYLTRAKKSGSDDPLLATLLASFDAKGHQITSTFSADPEAQALVHRGEQAFAKGNLDDARVLYLQALEHDPKNAAATLFIGDIAFNQGDYLAAIDWFNKASALQPNLETPYRYCGDAYSKLDRNDEALGKYVDAFVAEPYSRLPFEMLKRWAAQNRARINRPPFQMPAVSVELQNGKPSIEIDPAAGPVVLLYALARVNWLTEERAAFFGEDATPRHSLPEEKAGLEAVLTFADEATGEAKEELATWKDSVATLRRLKAAGFLEPFILFDRADKGIAQDYAAYRDTNRENLIRYIREIWLDQKPAG